MSLMKVYTREGNVYLSMGRGHGARAGWQPKYNDLESGDATCSAHLGVLTKPIGDGGTIRD